MRRVRSKPSTVTHKKTFTFELGRRSDLDVELTFDCHPAEKRVMYDRDGAGYPGCDAHVEIVAARVTTYSCGGIELLRSDRQDWFVMLDRIALHAAHSDADGYIESLCEDLGDDE